MKKYCLILVTCISFLSCQKASLKLQPQPLTQSILKMEDSEKNRLLRILQKYPDTTKIQGNRIFIRIPDDNIDSLESFFNSLEKNRLTEKQYDSIEKKFLQDFYKKHGTPQPKPQSDAKSANSTLGNSNSAIVQMESNVLDFETDVTLAHNASSLVMYATNNVRSGERLLPNSGSNVWLVSGTLPGSSSSPNHQGYSNQIGTGSDGTIAYKNVWLYTLTVKISILGSEFSPGTVVRATGYYNVGPNIPSFVGKIH